MNLQNKALLLQNCLYIYAAFYMCLCLWRTLIKTYKKEDSDSQLLNNPWLVHTDPFLVLIVELR